MLKISQTCIASSDILCSKSAPRQVTPVGDYLHLPRLWTEQYLPLLVGSYRRPSSPIGRAILAGGRASTTCYHYLSLLSLLLLLPAFRTHAKPPFSTLITVPLRQRGEACRLVKVLFPGLATGLIRRHSIWLTLASHVFPAYRHAGDAYPRAESRSRMQGSSTRSGPLPSLVLAFGQTEMPQGSLPTSSVTSFETSKLRGGGHGFFRIFSHSWPWLGENDG